MPKLTDRTLIEARSALMEAALAFKKARRVWREASAKAQPGKVGDSDIDAALDAEDIARASVTLARKALCDAAEAL